MKALALLAVGLVSLCLSLSLSLFCLLLVVFFIGYNLVSSFWLEGKGWGIKPLSG